MRPRRSRAEGGDSGRPPPSLYRRIARSEFAVPILNLPVVALCIVAVLTTSYWPFVGCAVYLATLLFDALVLLPRRGP